MDTIKTALRHAAEGRRKRTRTISLLLAMSTAVSLGVFRQLTLTGITATDDALCGIPEHTHDENCTADCTLAEHLHTLACFPDLEADLETYDDFLASLPDLKGLTGSAAVTVIAQSQLGAAESAKNFTVGDDGIRRGITRYGQWYGNPYGDWSAMFAAFCLHFAGYTSDNIPPHNGGVESMRLSWKNAGLLRTSGYTPAAGDLIFLDDDASGTADRIAITVTSAGGQLITVEGDVNGAVAASQIAADDARILGIGALPELAADTDEGATEVVLDSLRFDADGTAITPVTADGEPSDTQVVTIGGERSDSENGVTISKTIDGTDTENVFDITLTVTTPQKVEEIINEPDMAVVIVMDISQSMNSGFGSTTRYIAAMASASEFIKEFAKNNMGASRLGFVAFNTDAHKVFPLSTCTTAESTSLIQKMENYTGAIVNKDDYKDTHNRFTNVEAGLLMAQQMLSEANNQHKYIIFLSDGFPTTYSSASADYTSAKADNLSTPTVLEGYDPYTGSGTIGADGVFHDAVMGVHCDYGTSYSDTAAIKARELATKLKGSGTRIFSIGVDVEGQTIKKHHDSSAGKNFSIVERRQTADYYNTYGYEIGTLHSEITKANPTAAEVTKMAQDFKNWLRGSATDNSVGIGSGYYYDSTDSAGLAAAFNNIFTEIKTLNAQDTEALWVTSDSLPISTHPVMKEFEFIGFYKDSNSADKKPTLLGSDEPVVGRNTSNILIDNTAKIAEKTDENGNTYDEISWDLKNSIPKEDTSGAKKKFIYQLTYRVRLENENYEKSNTIEEPDTVVFKEFQTDDASTIYDSNANASLTYRILKSTTTSDGKTTVTIVNPKPLEYPIPAVKGWLGELSFTKQDNYGRAVEGAEFHLEHDDSCSTCRGDGESAVALDVTKERRYTATSDKDGIVTFANLPSGHTYLMTETKVPAGYASGNLTWKVNIAYNDVSVTPSDSSESDDSVWNNVVLNYTSYELPQTGGRGTAGYVLVGFTLLALPFTSVIRRRKGGRSASK